MSLAGLSALAGLSVGSSLSTETDDMGMREKLMANAQRFQNQLAEMSDESINKLSAFLNDAVVTLHHT